MSTSKSVNELDDSQLREELHSYGFNAGPISATTRSLLEKKLSNFRSGTSTSSNVNTSATSNEKAPSTKHVTFSTSQEFVKTAAGDSNKHQSNMTVTNVESSFNEKGMNFASTPKTNVQQASPSHSDALFTYQPVSIGPNRLPTPLPKQMHEFFEQDDSMETSRTLSPNERWNIDHQPPMKAPVRMLHDLRPPMFRMQQSSSSTQASDASKWLISMFVLFVAIVLLVYGFANHQGSILRGGRLVSDTIIGVFRFVYSFAIFPVALLILIGVVTFGAYFAYKKYKSSQETQYSRTMKLLDHIGGRVQNAGVKGVFELHLRDTLFPPIGRTAKELQIWSDAVQLLKNTDSRIRSESRLVNGVESNFLMWVNTPNEPQEPEEQVEKSSYGSTPPIEALSRCLKVYGMIDEHTKHEGKVKKNVYALLHPILPVHFGVGYAADNSAVYLMFSGLEEAKSAFDKLFGYWYQGHLVKVKFLTRECYVKRFPEVAGK